MVQIWLNVSMFVLNRVVTTLFSIRDGSEIRYFVYPVSVWISNIRYPSQIFCWISSIRRDVKQAIWYPDQIVCQISSRIFLHLVSCRISGPILNSVSWPDVLQDIQYTAGWKQDIRNPTRNQIPYPDRIFCKISSIRTDIEPDIRYSVGYQVQYPVHSYSQATLEHDATHSSAMPDGGIHRQITQNWRNSVNIWRWKMWRYRQKCYKSL